MFARHAGATLLSSLCRGQPQLLSVLCSALPHYATQTDQQQTSAYAAHNSAVSGPALHSLTPSDAWPQPPPWSDATRLSLLLTQPRQEQPPLLRILEAPKPNLAELVPSLEARPRTPTSRRTGVIAIKMGMSQEWDANGVRVPLTILWVDHCEVRGC